ncbi:MAG TPA: adenylate/guanylate cyclase domain-containing protein, partial [Roseiflexaceae bacterium]
MIDLSSADTALLETLLPAPLLASLHLREPPATAVAEACERLKSVLTTLIPFVPAPAIDLQLANPLLSGGRGLQMTGTVLLADLSGFTSLSSQLAAEGRRGDEAVSAIVRRLFSALIAEIEARGGRLLKFSGHTLTAFFDAARLGIDHAALAGSAALALQARMADFAVIETSKGVFRLRLRIAAHGGQIFAAEVGDRSHMEQVVTGAAINRVVSVLESASPGEVIISETMALLLGDAQTHRKLAGLYLLQGLASPPHPPAEQPTWRPGQSSPATLTALLRRISPLRAYLPYGLPRRFTRMQPEDGEFRPITLLFANFYAFSKLLALLELPALVEQDMGIVGRILNTYYTRIQTIMQRYGGSINTFDMASFGDRLMALFGAPIAHEDDPERAVRAALEIRATLDETNRTIAQLLEQWTGAHPNQRSLLNVANVRLRQRIAIAGGIVFAGVVGTPQRHEYMVMGEVVQVAARALAAAADGDLLLTSMTHRATRHLVEVEPLAPLARLHAAKSVPVFRVLGELPPSDHLTGIPPRATPLIGRQAELSDLVELARSALTSG